MTTSKLAVRAVARIQTFRRTNYEQIIGHQKSPNAQRRNISNLKVKLMNLFRSTDDKQSQLNLLKVLMILNLYH